MGAMRTDFVWVADAAALADLAPRCHAAPWLAVDTESNSMHVYRERVCLVQLNLGGELVLVDPLAVGPEALAHSDLGRALADDVQPCYLHGGEYDVVCLERDFGWRLGGVYDTQQAAAMLGLAGTGYAAVVAEVCGVELPKAYSHYDWGRRPLEPEAVAYAVDDVVYLPQVAEELQRRVAAADLEEEVAIANQAVAAARARSPGYDPATIYRLKGLRDVPQRHLAVAVALHAWRDATAVELDQPPGRVLANDALVALARVAPREFGRLKRLGLRGALLRERGEEVLGVIKAALETPPAIPEPPARREFDPDERGREQRLKRWRREEAERRGVPFQAILPARALDHLKRIGPCDLVTVPQLGDKRIRLYGETLQRLVAP